MKSDEGPTRGDRGFRAFLGIVLWVISGIVVVGLVAAFVALLVG